jgi:DtxR family Mn-dependent transcriptional regulator
MNRSPEDYLKNIFIIKESAGKVTTTVLADKMGISAPAVSDMISKLAKSGYITNTPYKGFELTKKGEDAAINLIRKHRIWEVFLVQKLGYKWNMVHDEAENLEHSSSDELIAKLEEYLSFPEYDPHGHPIPDKKGKINKQKVIPCTELNVGDKAEIREVSDASPEVLEYLSKVGLKLNDKFEVVEKISYDNSVQIDSGNTKIFLSEKLANNIYVRKNK